MGWVCTGVPTNEAQSLVLLREPGAKARAREQDQYGEQGATTPTTNDWQAESHQSVDRGENTDHQLLPIYIGLRWRNLVRFPNPPAIGSWGT